MELWQRRQKYEEWLGGDSGVSPASFPVLNCERLFNDRSAGDVVLVAADGQEAAHSLILCSASEVFKRMLTSEFEEGRTKTIEIPDATCIDLLFWLRLLYTGQVDEDDWLGSHEQVKSAYDVLVLCSRGISDEDRNDAARWQGRYYRDGFYLDAPKFRSESGRYLFCCSIDSGPSMWRFTEDDLESNPWPQDVVWVFSHPGRIDFPPTGRWPRMPNDNHWDEEWDLDRKAQIEINSAPETPPLKLFLSAIKLSSKYLVDHMTKPIVVKLFTECMTLENFEEMFTGAIELDHGLLRMACLRYATESREVRLKYFNHGFSHPGVLRELGHIWPTRHDIIIEGPLRDDGKRRRFM